MKHFYLAFVIALLTTTTQSQNLIPNGDFEIWTNNTQPQGFLPTTTETFSLNNFLTKESNSKHSGNFSARHTSQNTTQSIGQPGESLIPVTPGEIYTIRYWYYDNDNKARTRMWSSWVNAPIGQTPTDLDANASQLKPTTYSSNSTQWQKVEYRLTAPANATHFRFQVRTYRQSASQVGGYIYYDDFWFSPATAGSEDFLTEKNIVIYPNPVSSDLLFITSELNLHKHIVIYNLLGENVQENTLDSNGSIKIDKLSSGIYILQITEDNKVSTKKISIL